MWPFLDKRVRRCLVRRFPYGVVVAAIHEVGRLALRLALNTANSTSLGEVLKAETTLVPAIRFASFSATRACVRNSERVS
jgi:hypothetical protein